jgi:AraC-like DNA-binding protein
MGREGTRSLAARWESVPGQPHAALAGLVRGYQGYREITAAPMRRREMPDAQVVMIIDFGPALRILDQSGGQVRHQHRAGFVAGLHDSFTLTETEAAMSGIQINFTLTGARAFFAGPADALSGRVVALDDLLSDGRGLRDRLVEERCWASRFRIIDQVILERVARAAPLPRWLEWTWSQLQRSGGRAEIGALAREVGFSRKHLAASFRQSLGTTPKALARLLRFRRALAALRSGRPPDWTALALDCGYYDQAHFIRDFRQFSGGPPTELLRRALPGDRGVSG